MLYFVRLKNPLSTSLEKVLKLCSGHGVWTFISSPSDVKERGAATDSYASPFHPINSKAFMDTVKDNKSLLLDFLFARIEVFAFDPLKIPLGKMLSADTPFWQRGDSFTLDLCRHIFHEAKDNKTEDGQPLNSAWLSTTTDRIIAPLAELGYLRCRHLKEAKERAANSLWTADTQRAAGRFMAEIWGHLR